MNEELRGLYTRSRKQNPIRFSTWVRGLRASGIV